MTLRVWAVLLALAGLVAWALRPWLFRADIVALIAGVLLVMRILYLLDAILTRTKRIEQILSDDGRL